MSRALDPEHRPDTWDIADDETVKKIERAYTALQDPKFFQSPLRKYLTPTVFNEVKKRKTKFGNTLLDILQERELWDAAVGPFAPDGEAYSTFSELFDPMIAFCHNGFSATDHQPSIDYGESHIDQLGNLDVEGKYVKSTRIRFGRSLKGYPFTSCMTEGMYTEIETRTRQAFDSIMDPELKCNYHPLAVMTKNERTQLIADHLLFREDSRTLSAAGATKFWPSGRGLFINEQKNFMGWTNEEDHLRIISMQRGGDVGQTYKRLITGTKLLEKQLQFIRDDRLGFLTFCPSNLGTTVRASVLINIPKFDWEGETSIEQFGQKYHLEFRSPEGELGKAKDGFYDVSNRQRLGLTEFQAVKQMYDGVKKLIEEEKALEAKQ